jgi:6-pyruvoyltetrahydropterin/6-carboxytetrahydropterin synthase
MRHTLSKTFIFEAAHSLQRDINREASRRIHGHTYTAQIALRGQPHPASGMLLDLGHLEIALQRVKARLDHHFLDDVEGLGAATLENLCNFIWRNIELEVRQLYRVTVSRGLTGDSCSLERGDD